MIERANSFSAVRFHCGLLITLSWDLCPELQQNTWMGVHYAGFNSSSTHCTPWLHLYKAPQPHSPQEGSWGSRPLPGCCGRNEVSEQQWPALCLQIPDGLSHSGAPRGMCQSECSWLAGRPSTTCNLQSLRGKMSADRTIFFFFSANCNELKSNIS